MTFFKIRKRNGAIQTFDKQKIYHAIQKAFIATNVHDDIQLDMLVEQVMAKLNAEHTDLPDVELVQDTVEAVLIHNSYDAIAKAYILYRQKRSEARATRDVVVEVGQTMEEYLDRSDRRINANANSSYSLWWLILNVSGKVTANYRLSHIYPAEIGNLHRNADFHIHDLDMFSGYCAGWSLRQLLEEWFNGLPNKIESAPPKNLQAAVNQMINFLGTLQNERAGAQAFSSFDTYLAPFVHKYAQSIEKEIIELDSKITSDRDRQKYIDDKTYAYVLQQMQNFIFGLNVPSRRWTQTPFTNITLDWTCPEDLKDKSLLLGGLDVWPYQKTYGELAKEMNMINKALIQVYTKGDLKGRVFTFPIPTYNITEDFPREDPDIDLLFAMTAKYGIPYFQNFIGSQFRRKTDEQGNRVQERNPDAYTPGAVRSMCCRLQLDLTQLTKRGNGLFGSAEMTWSIGVVTINMARIGYQCKGDKTAFLTRVRYLMDMAKTSLEIKRKELHKRLDGGLYPYTKRYLHSFRNHFSTIGLNGVNEAIRNFSEDAYDITADTGITFATEVIEYMREVLKEYQEETGNLYNLEATPAEGTTYRFAREDKKQIPDIIQAGTQDAPYYTNSTQIPVEQTDDVFEALDLQNELQCKYTGGTVLHLYMGERLSDAQACKTLVKNVLSNYQLPYITVTPTFSICPKHGYLVGEHDYCPSCDAEIGYSGKKFDIDTRKTYTTTDKMEKITKTHIH
jgi:anaerobic ribonucleoside-triphosphate reductase